MKPEVELFFSDTFDLAKKQHKPAMALTKVYTAYNVADHAML